MPVVFIPLLARYMLSEKAPQPKSTAVLNSPSWLLIKLTSCSLGGLSIVPSW